MMQALLLMVALLPTRGWFAPDKPILIKVEADSEVKLVMTDFDGRAEETEGSTTVKPGEVDVRAIFPSLKMPGTYVLFATAPDGKIEDFLGTPLVIQVLADRRRGAPGGPTVIRVEKLQYAEMTTSKGKLTMVFFYDDAPNTVRSFLTLAGDRYFDGLNFHRIVPGFVIQGGDPRGDGTGGPGYRVQAEFNDRPHEAGALSMARSGDPNEAPGVLPRPEFADSAGSQFFICLDYQGTKQLDGRYTVFGKVTEGMNVVNAIAGVPLADPRQGKPTEPVVIEKVEVKPVDKAHNPYQSILFPSAGKTEAPPVPAVPAPAK